MYERNINVLEMFVEKKLGYVETNNIKNNYDDYKDLVKILDEYINICNAEIKAKQEYNQAITNIQTIQATEEKLYNQNVKFEYSRNILFSDVNRKVEDIEKCLTKIEVALDKNKETFKTLRQNFIQGIIDLNEKSRNLKQITRPKNKIETEYADALAILKENFYAINTSDVELTKKFVESTVNFEEELVERMMDNGKKERIPFDLDAIKAAVTVGLDIAKKEAENYLFMYDQTAKILGELENDKLKLEARKKHITDVGVKLAFLSAEKEYLVQFLDNERVTAIQGEAEHTRLMANCCKILKEDVTQIDTLYDLIIKETKKRATNRCYEELYNKSYLEDIQRKEQDFINKTTNVDYANGTIISPNYWRIDSIKAIYETFDKNVFETYGRKIVAPVEEVEEPKIVERVVERVVEKVVEKPVEKIIERVIEKPVEVASESASAPSTVEKTSVTAQADSKPVTKTASTKAAVSAEKTVQKTATQAAQATKTEKAAITKKIDADSIKKAASSKPAPTSEIEKMKNKLAEASTPAPKFKKIKKITPVEDATDSVISNENQILEEESIFSKPKSDDSELDDIEAIIRQAEASISSTSKKAGILKKMVGKSKGKYAAE